MNVIHGDFAELDSMHLGNSRDDIRTALNTNPGAGTLKSRLPARIHSIMQFQCVARLCFFAYHSHNAHRDECARSHVTLNWIEM